VNGVFNGLDILDVAIGLVFVYLVLSFLCSSINEGIETFLKNRSHQLESGIREILYDADGTKVAHLLYNHPLVCSLFQGRYDPVNIRKRFFFPGMQYRGRNLPSYIPSANFALAMLDIILPATPSQVGGTAGTLRRDNAPSAVETVRALRQAAANFPVPEVGKALTILIDASGEDLVRVRQAIEKWFDSSMDRVSGWYKRRTQVILFAIALTATSILNLNTIAIANRLATDPSVRNSLVATAQEYARREDIGRSVAGQQSGSLADQVAANLKELKSLGLPIGWEHPPPGGYAWFLTIVGILASAAAATLGAPFWFDVLNKFVVVRSTIKPQEKSGEEKSKD
jgi:hypothetical protein